MACTARAWAIGIGDGSWNGTGAEDAVSLLGDACDRRVRRACTELGGLLQALGRDEPEPFLLHHHACLLGEPVACTRALALAPVGAPTERYRTLAGAEPAGPEACAVGWVVACEGELARATGADRLGVLEALCHRDPARYCPELALARVADASSVPVPGTAPDEAWIVPGGVLLGWRGPSFRDHALVRFADLSRVELRQERDQIADLVVLVAADREWPLPPLVCSTVDAGVRTFLAAGVDVWAISMQGGAGRSMCLENAGDGRPDYHGGTIGVTPRLPGDNGPATDRKAKLDEAGAGLFACLVDTAPRSPFVAGIVHRRGPASKVKLEATSRDPAFDTCALAWLRATDLGTSNTTIRYTVRTELW